MLRMRSRLFVAVLTSGMLLGGLGLLAGTSADAAPQTAKERHPHLRAAIRELREARRELQTAAHDFGGHRVEAIEATDRAIKQLEVALKFDKR
jgi:hypothetical protein